MNNPREYSVNRGRQERDNIKCLKENVHKIKWKGQDKIIDVGAGDGGFTAKILRIFLPDDFAELVGVDRSMDMVRYANEMYSDGRVNFEMLDIREDLPQQFVGFFDHVFSFYTLHWVLDQEKAFTNIFNLLSDSGDCLLSILGDIPAYFSVNQIFASSEKWRPWVKDLEHVVSPYHGHPDPEPLLRKILMVVGFKHVEVTRQKHYYTYDSIDEFKNSVKSVTVFKIPGEMMVEYLEEYVNTAIAEGFLDQHLTIQMTFLEERDFSDVATIPEYFKGKTIFITGGTGFMGKILIEKLLYSCPEVDRIYLLLRNKRGLSPEDRIADLYKAPCFERLRKERPDLFMYKVFFVAGEISELGLGMSDEDWSLIANRTHVIFHVAASVRFDDHLTKATILNVRGTRELVRLAEDSPNLECFVHVSTSYCNTNRNPVDEVIYPPHADWRDTVSMCETMPRDDVQLVTQKYLGDMPNTYVFTKQLAEHVVYEHKGKLPIIIIRPSIVVSSLKEPIPGWIENFNGPAGIIVASGKGLIRAIYSNPKVTNDYIPVDLITRGIVAAAWSRGTKKLSPSDDIPVYNMCSGGYNCVSSLDLVHMGASLSGECPLDNAMWDRCSTVTDSKLLYNFKALFFQLIPSMLIDTLLWLLGKKPLLVKIQRKIYTSNYIALGYYTTQDWIFKINNFLKLRSIIKEEDKEDFYYEIDNIDIYDYFKVCMYGGRKYLMKEKDEDLPAAKVHDARIRLIAKITNHAFYGLVFIWMCKKLNQYLSLF